MNESNNEIERVKQKAQFYFEEKLYSHVIKNPKGIGFSNGYFKSELINDVYYFFVDDRWPRKEIKLLLIDIFDIVDYVGVGE